MGADAHGKEANSPALHAALRAPMVSQRKSADQRAERKKSCLNFLLLPAFCFAQFGDVSRVMRPVPTVNENEPIDISLAAIRMNQLSRKILQFERAQKQNPTRMERFKQYERSLDRCRPRISELGPFVLGVRFYGGSRFGERQLEAHIGVHVAIRYVMHQLPHR